MNSFDKIQAREGGLKRQLTARQMTMIALGGAIGTGLFLGSKFAIGFAGPSVIISYAIGGLIALLLVGCLSEMTVAHSTSGSFGAYAEHYVSPLAGFLVKYMYWSCIVLAVGTEVTAIGEYMKLWFPDVPALLWVVLFSAVLIAVNAMNVKAFGTLEYWFSTIKVFAIVAFIVLGAYIVFGSHRPETGLQNYAADGGFFPHGLSGTWFAVIVSIFSYLSIEMIAVAAGEAKDPAAAVKKAFRTTIVRLLLFYIVTLAFILAIAPVGQILAGGSPFVTVMQNVGIPYADSLLNFVVIIAALSAMNSQLYISTRMMFSLSRGGDAPSLFGRVRANGAPVNALILSTAGIAVATVVYAMFPETAFTFMMAISMFGAMFTWLMIFVTHWFFRRSAKRSGTELAFKVPFFPLGTLLGTGLMAAILLSTLATEAFGMTLVFGIPFVALVTAMYFVVKRRQRTTGSPDGPEKDGTDENAAVATGRP
ncbi:amino acid permease [Arthrobacter sp. AZCC_0090]|uniref:amino acid permease n=1 Tax=Arthrobacter sp. AZCC_0090 TaxID=2735881 RepID=UPI001621DF7E|nr:amino acid permease [Arthrobacter sp. AZCC_0090]MBB6405976.1 L-asparagine transporter-like permease [Arthrobacter sp. AZCC_0090]